MTFEEWEQRIEKSYRPVTWFNAPEVMRMFDDWKAERDKLITENAHKDHDLFYAEKRIEKLTGALEDYLKQEQEKAYTGLCTCGACINARAILAEVRGKG